MRKVTCLIVDDEPLALNLIEGYVKKTPFLELKGRCQNAFEAMEIMSREKLDLLFLDIQMPDLSGIEFSKTLHGSTKVIFTTSFEHYALEGFKVDALDYLLKPFNYEEFLKAAQKAHQWFTLVDATSNATTPAQEPEYLFVKSDYKLLRIDFKDVLYFEGLKDYVKIQLEQQDKPMLSLISLKALEDQLPEKRFMRIHRSFIINLDKIQAVERGQVIIKGQRITIADPFKDKFQTYLTSKSMNN